MTQYDHIHPDFRHLMALSDKDRILFMNQPRWISYPIAERTLDHLQGMLQLPKKPRTTSLLIVGESNNGKTTLVNRFFELCGKPYVDENIDPIKPIISVQSPPTADEKSLYLSLLQQFAAPHRASDAVSKLRYEVLYLFRKCQVQMLIIDEFHSLLTGSAAKQREVMNAIKWLCNELAIPIVGVGTREAVRVLHTDPQHSSRFDVMALPLWELNKDFQQLLANYETVLPLRAVSNLHKPQIAQQLHAISEGNLGNVLRLIVQCATQAIESGQELIDADLVQSNAWLRPTRGIREHIG